MSTCHKEGARQSRDEIDTCWRRFDSKGMPESESHAYVWLEKNDGVCKVGFKTDADHGCPLIHFNATPDNLEELLVIVKKEAAFRKAQAEHKYKQEAMEAQERAKRRKGQ